MRKPLGLHAGRIRQGNFDWLKDRRRRLRRLFDFSASGTLFKTSSFYRFSAEKNGAFNAVDDGVSPDYKLTELRSFYNRSDKDGLTAFIQKLY